MSDPLLEIDRPGYHLRLWLKNEQMECRGDLEIIAPSADVSCAIDETQKSIGEEGTPDTERDTTELRPPEVLTPVELIQFLRQHDISQTIDFENLYHFCAATAEGVNQRDVLLAKGIAPQSGTDGWFEAAFKTPDEPPEYEEDDKGNVDLRSPNSYSEINPGQKLGTVHPPENGIAGMTINGLAIPAERGKPFNLLAGAGVELKYEGRVAFAKNAGRALLDKQTLSVVDELVIPGDLDLKIGNIDFHGFVEIKGDVPDDFTIKASKGIRIRGTIGACRIESGGSIEIGSMAGKETGQIVCHGDLKANYLNQARVACYGDVLIANEIRNSQVKATGQIIVERGAILGGRIVALEGIEANTLGSNSGQRTRLVAGVYFPDADRFNYLHKRLDEIARQLKLIHDALGPLEHINGLGDALDKASDMRLSILNLQWEKLEQEKKLCGSELEASQPQEFSNCNPKINARKAIMEGVIVELGKETENFKAEMPGPLTLIENTKQGGLRYLSLSTLGKLAATVEEEILHDEQAANQQEPSMEVKTENGFVGIT